MKKVLVSGCFDLLHAGHIAFLEEAASLGELHVRVGSDENVTLLKGRPPLYSQEERVYVLEHVACVAGAAVAGGSGMLDFEPDLERLRPDLFVVNEDGHTEGKAELCRRHGVRYVVLQRVPARDFTPRSSTDTKERLELPYRVCLAGGWVDQPWVSELHPGSVVVVGLEPTVAFADRSGMATSSRRLARELWGDRLPSGDLETTAKMLFAYENPPGTKYVSGAQDAIGLVYPGVNRMDYAGSFWPERIESTRDPEVVAWLESVLHFVPLAPRPDGYDPLLEQHLTPDAAQRLGEAGRQCWDAILNRDVRSLGESMTRTVEGWKEILPLTVNEEIEAERARYDHHPGAVFSGCGGGYIVVASEEPVERGFPVKVRRTAED